MTFVAEGHEPILTENGYLVADRPPDEYTHNGYLRQTTQSRFLDTGIGGHFPAGWHLQPVSLQVAGHSLGVLSPRYSLYEGKKLSNENGVTFQSSNRLMFADPAKLVAANHYEKPRPLMKQNYTTVACTFIIFTLIASSVRADPLPSWTNGPAKKAIIVFVERITNRGSDDFVPVASPIAVFDNDGTLWCEAPVPPQAAFAAAEIERMLPENPAWNNDAALQALQKGDFAALGRDHHKGLLEIVAKTHAGRTPDNFSASVKQWLATARHPKFGRPYDQTVFQPMLELLAYLRDHGFETWIVSGGGQDFMRSSRRGYLRHCPPAGRWFL